MLISGFDLLLNALVKLEVIRKNSAKLSWLTRLKLNSFAFLLHCRTKVIRVQCVIKLVVSEIVKLSKCIRFQDLTNVNILNEIHLKTKNLQKIEASLKKFLTVSDFLSIGWLDQSGNLRTFNCVSDFVIRSNSSNVGVRGNWCLLQTC